MFQEFGQNNIFIGIRPKRGLINKFGGFGFGAAPDPNFVTKVYREVLGREPDPGGLTFWTNTLAESGDYTWFLAAFKAAAIANGERLLTVPPTSSELAVLKATSEVVSVSPNTGQVVSVIPTSTIPTLTVIPTPPVTLPITATVPSLPAAQVIPTSVVTSTPGVLTPSLAGIPTWGIIALGGVALFLLFGRESKGKQKRR